MQKPLLVIHSFKKNLWKKLKTSYISNFIKKAVTIGIEGNLWNLFPVFVNQMLHFQALYAYKRSVAVRPSRKIPK